MSRAGVGGPIGATVFYFILEGFRVGVNYDDFYHFDQRLRSWNCIEMNWKTD